MSSFKLSIVSPKSTYKSEAQDVDSAAGREYLHEMVATTTHREETLDYHQWLPAAARKYNISSRIEDYVIVNTPMIPSDIPNRNGVAFPLYELVQFQPPPVNRLVYKSWVGCPCHEEHQADDYTKALGIILDTSMVQIKNFGNGRHYMVMALLAFDKNKYPERVQKIQQGKVNTYSMGATCEYFTCGMSGVRLDQPKYSHRMQKPLEFDVVPDPLTYKDTLIFRNAHQLVAGECSTVDDPAWAPALSDIIYELGTP